MIAISNLGKAYGQQTLFTGVSCQLIEGNRYGVVGANGSGKSTFLRILSGDELPSDGEVNIPKRAVVGVLRQDHFQFEDVPIVEVAMRGRAPVWKAMQEKEEILARAEDHFEADRYAELEEIVLAGDGYSLEADAGGILEGLGIPTEVHRQPLSTLSGGFKLRVLLAQVLVGKPDVLLLDEPTNHLDILSIRWLEKFLSDFLGCVAVISHDHRFLDNVCSHVLDVDYETITLYPGNYSRFEVAKREDRERKESEIAKREREIADHQAFVDRFRAKATKARQAQSRVKRIEKMVIERLPQSSRRYPTFRFEPCRPSGKVVVSAERITKRYGEKTVLSDVDVQVQRGDRLAIIGPNGIGKSTLVKILVGEVESDAGAVEWGYETHPGYFPQDHHSRLTDERRTVESWLWDASPGEPIGFVRGKLGLVLFSGEDVHKRLGSLSGGEAARLIFARLGVERPNVLLLDEPTNHLDLEAIEALVGSLEAYEGTLIFVSHDRWFVSRLANRILEITSAGITDYRGTYEEYLERCGDDHLDADQVVLRAKRERKRERSAVEPSPRTAGEERQLQRRRRELQSERDRITAEIERAEERVHDINEIFVEPGYFERTDPKEVRRLEAEQKRLSAKTEELMAAWERIEGDLAELEA